MNNADIINSVTKQLYLLQPKIWPHLFRVGGPSATPLKSPGTAGDVDVLSSRFGYTIHSSGGKPTNGRFIAMIADKLRLRLKIS